MEETPWPGMAETFSITPKGSSSICVHILLKISWMPEKFISFPIVGKGTNSTLEMLRVFWDSSMNAKPPLMPGSQDIIMRQAYRISMKKSEAFCWNWLFSVEP